MSKLESTIDRLKAFAIVMIVIAIFNFLTSCSYETKCPTYTHINRKTSYGEKSQAHYAKKHKKIQYLMF